MSAMFEAAVSRIVELYPSEHKGDLTILKLNLLTYLVDWHLRINLKVGFDGVVWLNDAFGPKSKEMQGVLNNKRIFQSSQRISMSGRQVTYYNLAPAAEVKEAQADLENSISHVLRLNAERRSDGAADPGAEFKRLVLSTFGVMNTERNSPIDIEGLALIYRRDILKK